jgi:streptomycin 6-kinase
MLLERLGPSLADMHVPIGLRHEIMCDAVVDLWRPAPDCGLRTGAEKAAWLAEEIPITWERLGRPCSSEVVDHAIRCAHRRGAQHDDERAVLVHGDVHQWNTLATLPGASRPFKLIDPDGLLADAEYDLGIIMREDPVELLADPRARSRCLAERTGCDDVRIWEWGVVERVSTGLLTIDLGGEIEPIGRAMLATAEIATTC